MGHISQSVSLGVSEALLLQSWGTVTSVRRDGLGFSEWIWRKTTRAATIWLASVKETFLFLALKIYNEKSGMIS